jgi:DNA ligase 1
MEYSKTIYKKDTKGKIRFLTVSADNGELVQESGIVGGKPIERRSACKAKNVGRANETTPLTQAISEAESKIATKMSEGYFESIDEAENEVVVLPMLAKPYDKEAKKVEFPCYVQPKLDGMRCLIVIKDGSVKMFSRKGKEITTLPHIIGELMTSGLDNIIMDGELYVHGESFQDNMSLIKKYRPGESEKILFRWYDIVSDESFEDRNLAINTVFTYRSGFQFIQSVGTYQIHDEGMLKSYHLNFLEDGYEGTMVRWGDAGYKVNGRSSNLLKYKDFLDESYEVVDVKPSDKNPEQGVVVCRVNDKSIVTTPDGEWLRSGDASLEFVGTVEEGYATFGCGMKFSHAEREEILANKEEYIGQMAEVRFFEYTDSGLPRFPVCVGFRLDK